MSLSRVPPIALADLPDGEELRPGERLLWRWRGEDHEVIVAAKTCCPPHPVFILVDGRRVCRCCGPPDP